MDPERIELLISVMSSHEIRDGLRFVDVFEQSGSVSPADADEWRRRILARQRFLELDERAVPTA